MKAKKTIALVAHDSQKPDMIEWVEENWATLMKYDIVCTGTTGTLVEQALKTYLPKEDFDVQKIKKLKSGPLGGDQQLGAMIADTKVDMLIFFWDPMQAQPHDVDVKALLRITTLYNIPTALNRSSADFIITSSLMGQSYTPVIKDYSAYINRSITIERA